MQLRAENLRKRYGDVVALDGLSLQIPADTTFGVLGTNGAGKTTLFRLFVGLETPDAGSLSIGGRDVVEAGDQIRRQVGFLPERIGFPRRLTGREVLEFHCRMRGISTGERIDEAVETVGLTAKDARRAVQGYSNGMRRRLGLAAAIVARPEVLILDEPTAGLDPKGVVEFHRIVRRARSLTGATVIVASHVLSEVERLCDRVAILDDGRTVAQGPVNRLTADEPGGLEAVFLRAIGAADYVTETGEAA